MNGFEQTIYHTITLIKNHIVALVQDEVVVLQTVEESPGSSNGYLHSFAQNKALLLDTLSSYDADRPICCKHRQLDAFFLNLLRQLHKQYLQKISEYIQYLKKVLNMIWNTSRVGAIIIAKGPSSSTRLIKDNGSSDM